MYKKSNFLGKELFSNISSMNLLPSWIILLIDLFLCTLAFYVSHFFVLSLSNLYPSSQVLFSEYPFETRLILVLFFQVISFRIFNTYAGVVRHTAWVDFLKISCSSITTLLTLIVLQVGVKFLFHYDKLINIPSLLLYTILAIAFMMVFRLMVKFLFYSMSLTGKQVIPVAFYGEDIKMMSYVDVIKKDPNSFYKVMLCINNATSNVFLQGKKVIKDTDHTKLLKELQRLHIRTIIISPHQFERLDWKKDLDYLIDAHIKILRIPEIKAYSEISEHASSEMFKSAKGIQIEDLLNRKPIAINQDNISSFLKGKIIMVTGCAGSIGSEIVRQVSHFKPKFMILFDQAETPMHNLFLQIEKIKDMPSYKLVMGDMRDKIRLEDVLSTYKPEVIFHAAAYKHVPMMELNASEAVLTNVMGTRNLADLALKYKVRKFVMISTDKAVNPTNVMGATKRLSEMYTQSLNQDQSQTLEANRTAFITTRFGNVLGSNGSVIPLFRQQIEQGGPLTVTDPKIIRYFMTIPEACQLVLEAGSAGQGGEIYIFDMGEPVKILDLATKMIRLSGHEPYKDIDIVFTGLRPGEKLYEELLNNDESKTTSYNEKIMIANVEKFKTGNLVPELDRMIEYAHHYKNYLVVKSLKTLVKEYKSGNSQYESIDLELQDNKVKN